MGVRTRGLDIKASAKRATDDRAARADAKAVVDRWNEQLAAGRDMLWSPTIRAAILAGTPWLDVFCPGCRTSCAIDLRTIDRHPLASVGAGLAVFMVPRRGADAEAAGLVRAAAVNAIGRRGALRRRPALIDPGGPVPKTLPKTARWAG